MFLDIVLFLPLLILCLRANANSAHFSFYLLLPLRLSERQQESKMKEATLKKCCATMSLLNWQLFTVQFLRERKKDFHFHHPLLLWQRKTFTHVWMPMGGKIVEVWQCLSVSGLCLPHRSISWFGTSRILTFAYQVPMRKNVSTWSSCNSILGDYTEKSNVIHNSQSDISTQRVWFTKRVRKQVSVW